MNRLGQTYEALTSLLQQNADVGREVTDRTQADEEIYRKLRRSLERANEAPRCRWVKQDGTSCGSPQIRRHIYCYAHKQMMEARAMALRLPALEDANAIQISLMRVQKAMIDDTISVKKAGLLLYSLQLAITNVGQTTFGEADEQDLVTDLVDEEEALNIQIPNPFTTEDTHSTPFGRSGQAEEHRGERTGEKEKKPERALPQINAEERGLEEERLENVLSMRAGGADWDKHTPNWDAVG
jgi:hypothetical protein